MPSDSAPPAVPGAGKLIAFPRRSLTQRRAAELEFLPGALEIIETPASAIGRLMMGVIVILVVVAVAWACFGKVDIIAVANGRLIPAGEVKTIQPLELGVVKRVAVTEGEHVRRGDLLVELDPTTTEADVARISRDLMQARLDSARLLAQLADDASTFTVPPDADPALVEAERRQLLTELAQHRAKLDGIDQQIRSKTAERQQAMETIAKLDATLPIIQRKTEIYEKVAENQYVSKIAVLDAQKQLIDARYDRLTTAYQVQQGDAQIATLVQQRKQTEDELRDQDMKDLAKAKQTAAQLLQESIKARQRAKLQTLRAPVDGTVEQISVHTIGGVVTPAQTLMIVVPDKSKLEIEAALPNREVGFVEVGQPVEVKVEAYNYTRYGLLHGYVRLIGRDTMRNPRPSDAVSTDPFAPKQPSPRLNGMPGRDSPYMLRIALAESTIDTEQGKMQLGPGMAVTAEIKTGRRRVIEYLLSPIMRYRHESLRER